MPLPARNAAVRCPDFAGTWGHSTSRTASSTTSSFGTDLQGSVRVLVSIGGVVTDSYTYKAFGEELATSGTTTNYNRYIGLYGYYRDLPNRLYVRARYLDVIKGRWISKDPIGFNGEDMNLYRYAANRPLIAHDPSGFSPSCDCCSSANINQYYAKMQSACQGGLWQGCSPARNISSCNYTRKTPGTNKKGFCDEMYNRLISLLNATNDCTSPPNYGSGNVGAATMCCCNGNTPEFCAIKCCSNSGLPDDNGAGACINYCLYYHETIHALMCQSAKCPTTNPNDPSNFPHNEPYAWAAEIKCLYSLSQDICQAKYWPPTLIDRVKKCQQRFAQPDCP